MAVIDDQKQSKPNFQPVLTKIWRLCHSSFNFEDGVAFSKQFMVGYHCQYSTTISSLQLETILRLSHWAIKSRRRALILFTMVYWIVVPQGSTKCPPRTNLPLMLCGILLHLLKDHYFPELQTGNWSKACNWMVGTWNHSWQLKKHFLKALTVQFV